MISALHDRQQSVGVKKVTPWHCATNLPSLTKTLLARKALTQNARADAPYLLSRMYVRIAHHPDVVFLTGDSRGIGKQVTTVLGKHQPRTASSRGSDVNLGAD